MTALRRFSPALCSVLLALALLGRLALPAGWMPQVDAGGIRMVICTGAGPVTVTMDADGTVHRDGPDAPRNPCPYGLAGTQALALPDLPQLAAPLPEPAALEPRALHAARLTARRALRPPARGPPRLA